MLECFSMTTTRNLPDEGEKDVKERMLRVWVGGAGSLISLEWKMTDTMIITITKRNRPVMSASLLECHFDKCNPLKPKVVKIQTNQTPPREDEKTIFWIHARRNT